ncbi:MFS transporter [Ideonella sp. A 288]|uniref:MFS transporter n=1 Tax=Ideonella sp. A 288 TaxID=1962181 RepID=UPI000B4C06E5|nr:MFS transporter [Ideonella sp. A 288]
MQALNRLVAAEVVSNFGSMLSRLAIPWLAAITLQATPWQMGWLVAADVAAGALGSLWLGAWVDRHPPRAVMLAADAARAALLAALAVAAALQWLSMPLLVLAAAVGGLLSLAFELARSAWMARGLAADTLVSCNARLSMGGSLSETAAFALGGWLFQGLGAVVALGVDALSYLGSALFVRGLADAPAAPGAPAGPTARRSLRAEAHQGLAAVSASPLLRRMAAIESLLSLAMGLTGATYMVYLVRDLGFGPGAIGSIAATGALGAVIGGALAVRLGRRWGPWRTMALGLAATAAGAACIPLAASATLVGAAWLVAHQVVGDAGATLHQVHERTLRQTGVAPDLLARVDGTLRMLGQGLQLVGALGGGALAGAIGPRAALVLAALLVAAAVPVALATARRSAR